MGDEEKKSLEESGDKVAKILKEMSQKDLAMKKGLKKKAKQHRAAAVAQRRIAMQCCSVHASCRNKTVTNALLEASKQELSETKMLLEVSTSDDDLYDITTLLEELDTHDDDEVSVAQQ